MLSYARRREDRGGHIEEGEGREAGERRKGKEHRGRGKGGRGERAGEGI